MQTVNLLDEEWEFLTDLLPKDWREQARTSGALRRARGIGNADSLLQLILMHTATGLSLRQTVVRAHQQSLANISDVALLKRLRSSEPWLRWLTSQMTEIGEAEIVRRVCVQRRVRELTDEHGGETYKRLPVAPQDLLLADRGYSNAAGVSSVRDAQGDVLVRWNSFSFPLKTLAGKPFEALKELSKLPKRGAREWAVCFEHGGKKYTGRLCAIRKNAVAAARAREKMRQKAIRKQKKLDAEALKLAEFVVVFTTIGPEVLDTREVLELYRVRWQIELRFKHLKSLLGLGCLPKYDEQSCRAWIQAKLLCGLLIERLMREAKFFFPWGYRLPATEPLARVH